MTAKLWNLVTDVDNRMCELVGEDIDDIDMGYLREYRRSFLYSLKDSSATKLGCPFMGVHKDGWCEVEREVKWYLDFRTSIRVPVRVESTGGVVAEGPAGEESAGFTVREQLRPIVKTEDTDDL